MQMNSRRRKKTRKHCVHKYFFSYSRIIQIVKGCDIHTQILWACSTEKMMRSLYLWYIVEEISFSLWRSTCFDIYYTAFKCKCSAFEFTIYTERIKPDELNLFYRVTFFLPRTTLHRHGFCPCSQLPQS